MAGLLSDVLPAVYSYGDTMKRKLQGLLDDPLGTIAQGVQNFGQDQAGLLNLQANAYPLPGDKTVLNTPEQIDQFRQQLAQKGADMAIAATIGGAALPKDIASNERVAKMADMGMEGGWFRGGPQLVNAKRSGPWYTRDAEEASGYAARFGSNADVREYAIPKDGFLKADGGYSSRLAHDVADIVENPTFGGAGAHLAKELRTFGADEAVSGGALWQALESRFGNDGAANVLQQLGFNGAKGITGGPEAYVFNAAPVRDAQRAAFNPANAAQDNVYGRASLPFLGLLGGTATAAGYLGRKDQQAQPDKTPPLRVSP